MIKILLFSLLSFFSLASYGQTQSQSQFVGTGELVYVAPSDALDTDPRGVTNFKLYFTAEGKNRHDQAGSEIIRRDAFQRLSIQDQGCAGEVSYDGKDYSGLALEKRLLGIWEVVGFRNVPQDQLPPYGFLNDVWVITKDSITLALRYAQKTDTIPFAMKDGQLVATDAVLGGRGAPLLLRPTFDKWGRLVLSRADVDIVLKLVSKGLDHVPAIPVKVAVTRVAGQ